jgi:hypothetical protein
MGLAVGACGKINTPLVQAVVFLGARPQDSNRRKNTGHFHAQGVSASDPVTPGKRALRLNGLNEAV